MSTWWKENVSTFRNSHLLHTGFAVNCHFLPSFTKGISHFHPLKVMLSCFGSVSSQPMCAVLLVLRTMTLLLFQGSWALKCLFSFPSHLLSSFSRVGDETACSPQNAFVSLLLFRFCVTHLFSLKRTRWEASITWSLTLRNQWVVLLHPWDHIFSKSSRYLARGNHTFVHSHTDYSVYLTLF